MGEKIRWGILGTAKISAEHLIPALNSSDSSEVVAVASRSMEKARSFADRFGIAERFGSYEDMLRSDAIDVVYNPLPNHLHVPLALEAARAGKHVLCEKPVSLDAKEAERLRELPPGILFMEAFMVRFHRQWEKVAELLGMKKLGEVRAVQIFFSFFGDDPANIRNNPETGGGAMYDLGCYANVISKYVFGKAPERVAALADIDARFNVDRLTSGIFDFGEGKHLTFSVSTQLTLYQRVNVVGTRGRLEILIPFNAPGDEPTRILFDDGSDLGGRNIETIEVSACNQYRLECEAMNQAIRGESTLPYSVEDAIENAKILDAVFLACRTKNWETPSHPA